MITNGHRTEEQEVVERRAEEYLPRIDQEKEAGGGLPAPNEPDERLAVVELCKAEQANFRYWRTGEAIKRAIMELEFILYPYEEELRHHNYRGAERQAIYDYMRTMIHKSLAELKSAQEMNRELGKFTAKKVEAASVKLNPEVQRQAKEQSREAERATRFCENFLNWISKYEEPVNQGT